MNIEIPTVTEDQVTMSLDHQRTFLDHAGISTFKVLFRKMKRLQIKHQIKELDKISSRGI
jgi:hypothetical protein